MEIGKAIQRVVDGRDLTVEEAECALDAIMSGQCTDAQIACLLTALRMKGETVEELTGFALVMRRKVRKVTPRTVTSLFGSEEPALLDTCGTGGDMSGSFNVSTAAAFVVAGAGVLVAKHGNRSASSRCGSADVVEALGVKLEIEPEHAAECIDRVGIGFLHAPLLHTAMKHVAVARREMGIRTIFNALGPLTNPAAAPMQLIGVYSERLTEVVAGVLKNLGSHRALVVHGADGMDEVTTTTRTKVTELFQGRITTYFVTPEQYGLPLAAAEDLHGAGNAPDNAELILQVLRGYTGPRRDIVLLNAAAALLAAGRVQDLSEGIEMARRSIDEGLALSKLRGLIELTNGF